MVDHYRVASEYRVIKKSESGLGTPESKEYEGKSNDNQLIRESVLDLSDIYSAIGFDFNRLKGNYELLGIISPRIIKMYGVLPIAKNHRGLKLAFAGQPNEDILEDISILTGMDIIPVLVDKRSLDTAINRLLAMAETYKGRFSPVPAYQQGIQSVLRTDMHSLVAGGTSVVETVNSILKQAVKCLCSDIHIEPSADDIRVRFRLDGELYEVLRLSLEILGTVVSRLKVMAAIDIAEKRLPQDGHMQMQIDHRKVDFRVATLPTIYGEKVVIRILDRANALMSVNELGYSYQARNTLLNLCYKPYGMILVTGPTGSGKTTTLYSILEEINSVSRNVLTIEDPVEYPLAGINQVQVNPKAGLTFAGGLRFILRQDPDTIMVGEIRDKETAELAVHAALTGHLVFSTLHTNNAAGALIRLVDMGLKQFLVANAVIGVIAQRLARRLCKHCRDSYLLDEKTALRMGIPEAKGRRFYRAKGCAKCRYLGYRGRIALQEIMVISPGIKNLIMSGKNLEETIIDFAIAEGMSTIAKDAMNKAKKGLISLEEALKVIYIRRQVEEDWV